MKGWERMMLFLDRHHPELKNDVMERGMDAVDDAFCNEYAEFCRRIERGCENA